MTLADTSAGIILSEGKVRELLGARLLGGVTEVITRRVETPRGMTAEASHDGYVRPFGIRHERELTLSPQGLALTGADRLLPQEDRKGDAVPFALRFHIHPDVRVSRAQSGDVFLKLPNGEGWRFRSGVPVTIEESVYLGNDTIRRSEQLVLTGTVKDTAVEIAWMFEQIGAG